MATFFQESIQNQWNLHQHCTLVQVPRVLPAPWRKRNDRVRLRRRPRGTGARSTPRLRTRPTAALCSPPPAAPVPLGAAMRMGCDGAQRARVLPLHPQGSPAAGGHLKMPSWWPAMAHSCPVLHWGHTKSQCEPLKHFLAF